MTDISLKGKASRLKVLVSETGATRQAFADLTGKTAQAAQDWINSGKIKDENLQLIADRYGYNITWLITGDGDVYLTDTIGHRIHAARMGQGMTQAVLADKSRCIEGDIFRWETDSETPSKNQLIYLSAVLDVDPEWLMTGSGPKRSLSPVQQRIAAALQTADMQACQLADGTNGAVDEATIGDWLNGSVEPTDRELELIAPLLYRSVEYLKAGISNIHNLGTGSSRQVMDVQDIQDETHCTEQWELDAITALRGMDDDRRRRALQDLADGAELERLKKAGNC